MENNIKVLCLFNGVSSFNESFFSIMKKFYKSNAINFREIFDQVGPINCQKEILSSITDFEPDIVILEIWPMSNIFDLYDFKKQLSDKTKLVLLSSDDTVFFDSFSKYISPYFDHVITTCLFCKNKFEELGVSSFFYFSSYDSSLFFRPKKIIKDIDVSFVGAVKKADRLSYIESLEKAGVNVQVFGKGSSNGFISKEKMVEIFQRSKICLNFTKIFIPRFIDDSFPLQKFLTQSKGRPSEIFLSGSFCLSEYSGDYISLFRDEFGDFLTFKNIDELKSIIERLLHNDLELNSLSDRGYKIASDISSENVINEIISSICLSSKKSIVNSQPGIRESILRSNHYPALLVFSYIKWLFIALIHFDYKKILDYRNYLRCYSGVFILKNLFKYIFIKYKSK